MKKILYRNTHATLLIGSVVIIFLGIDRLMGLIALGLILVVFKKQFNKILK